MTPFSKEHLESLNNGDTFETPSLMAGIDPEEKLKWNFIHRGKSGAYYFDVYAYGDVLVTSVEARITPRGVMIEEME